MLHRVETGGEHNPVAASLVPAPAVPSLHTLTHNSVNQEVTQFFKKEKKVGFMCHILVCAILALFSISMSSPLRTFGRNSLSCITSVVNFSSSRFLTLTKQSLESRSIKNYMDDKKVTENSRMRYLAEYIHLQLFLFCKNYCNIGL